jgi:hypothetical protein
LIVLLVDNSAHKSELHEDCKRCLSGD